MLKWWSGGSRTTTVVEHQPRDGVKNDDEDSVPSFPSLNSIQRAGGGGGSSSSNHTATTTTTTTQLQDTEESDEQDEYNEEEEEGQRHAIANLDLFISPPSPASKQQQQSSSSRDDYATRFEVSQHDTNEFKAPSLSFTVTSPPTSTPSVAVAKNKPKPSHRPFPPSSEVASTLTPSTMLLNNGRVVASNNSGRSSQAGGKTLGSSSSLGLPPSTTVKPRKQRFVALEPGYSPLDWARLNKEGDDDELRVGFWLSFIRLFHYDRRAKLISVKMFVGWVDNQIAVRLR